MKILVYGTCAVLVAVLLGVGIVTAADTHELSSDGKVLTCSGSETHVAPVEGVVWTWEVWELIGSEDNEVLGEKVRPSGRRIYTDQAEQAILDLNNGTIEHIGPDDRYNVPRSCRLG